MKIISNFPRSTARKARCPEMSPIGDALRVPPGAIDPHARLHEMDAQGIDIAILYPTIGLASARTLSSPRPTAVPITTIYSIFAPRVVSA
jgi:hypothetical protein